MGVMCNGYELYYQGGALKWCDTLKIKSHVWVVHSTVLSDRGL
jgi:hypothetical protein